VGNQNNLDEPGIRVLVAGAIIGIFIAIIIAASYHAAGSPAFCMACHSMKNTGRQWRQSFHKQFACIECHLPDSNIAVKVAYKTKAGLNDLYHETLRTYPASIRLSAEARWIAEGNCLRCHFSTVGNTFMAGEDGNCLKCHHRLVHGPAEETGGIKVE
jgi:cytochrome c nitrite reductase small subunit